MWNLPKILLEISKIWAQVLSELLWTAAEGLQPTVSKHWTVTWQQTLEIFFKVLERKITRAQLIWQQAESTAASLQTCYAGKGEVVRGWHWYHCLRHWWVLVLCPLQRGFPWGDKDPCLTQCYLGPHKCPRKNGISFRPTALAGCRSVIVIQTYVHTDRQTMSWYALRSMCSNRQNCFQWRHLKIHCLIPIDGCFIHCPWEYEFDNGMKQLHKQLVRFLPAVLQKVVCLVIFWELDELCRQILRHQMCSKAVPL